MSVHAIPTVLPAPRVVETSLQTLQFSDVEDVEAAFGSNAFCIQLSAGSFSGSAVRLCANAVSITACAFNCGIQLRREIPESRLALALVTPTVTPGLTVRRQGAEHFIVASGHEMCVNTVTGAQVIVVDVDLEALPESTRSALSEAIRDADIVSPAHAKPFVDLRQYADAALQMCTADTLLLRNNTLRATIESELLQRIAAAVAASAHRHQDVHRLRKSALIRTVEQYMWANVEEPLTLAAICENTDCRVRTLIYSFKEWFGIGPMGYLKILRLNAVRRRLKQHLAPSRIFDVAADFGFWHMGHFSADYKRMFGETASATLHRPYPRL